MPPPTWTPLDTPTTPRLLKSWQLLHASPTPRTHGQSFIPAGDFTPVPVQGMPQIQQPSTHTDSPQPAVLGNVSQLLLQTDAPNSHLTHGRYFGIRSAPASPTAAAFRPHPTLFRRTSVQSSTPSRSSPTTIPKTLHRQPQTIALN